MKVLLLFCSLFLLTAAWNLNRNGGTFAVDNDAGIGANLNSSTRRVIAENNVNFEETSSISRANGEVASSEDNENFILRRNKRDWNIDWEFWAEIGKQVAELLKAIGELADAAG